MVNNDIAVFINGINLTRYVVMPLKWANLLDERLDEGIISLRNCPVKVIAPLSTVEIRINNSVVMGSQTTYNKQKTMYMIVSSIADSNENPVGSGRYDHELNIIEPTKLLERIIVDSITYTNVNSKIFTANARPMRYDVTYRSNASSADYDNHFKGEPSTFVSPIETNTALTLPSWNTLWTLPSALEAQWVNINIQVINSNGSVIGSTTSPSSSLSVNIPQTGYYTIVYNGQYSSRPGRDEIIRNFPTLTFYLTATENHFALKKLTITDVINRLLDVAEPITAAEQPRFTLDSTQAALFDNILAPQFSFTKQTLRECLQAIGGVVHGEPRLNVVSGTNSYVISYDLYGSAEFGNVQTLPYVKETVSQVIDQYCTSIDTSAENLVNAIGESVGAFVSGRNGVITEPYDGGFKTVRCDSIYTRITEDNMLIATQLPIYAIQKLECGIIPQNENAGANTDTSNWTTIAGTANATDNFLYAGEGVVINADVVVTSTPTGETGVTATVTQITNNRIYFTLNNTDIGIFNLDITVYFYPLFNITPYAFESSIYNSQLSSYGGIYPYSKAYALVYTQGSKNITGLNFKQDNAISPVFEKYAIINILEEVSGRSINITTEYPLLAFRVTYTPFYSARVAQTKPYIGDTPRGSTLIYNQGANVIESRFYGENLKGVIARLGNVEKTKTYRLSRLGLIPKAGQKYDEDYYISAVNVELFPNLINVTIGLSKDFNRLSQYIGISSVKRFSEVSQTQALERNVLYRDYIVIGDNVTADSDSRIGDTLLNAISATFTADRGVMPVTSVIAWGSSYNGVQLPIVQLPVIGLAFGNSISFEWAYEDNYSAGAVSQYETNGSSGIDKVSGFFQNNYQYTDFYGRMYYYNFDLQSSGTIPANFDEQSEIGCALPGYSGTAPTTSSGYVSTLGISAEKMRKDNREIIKVNEQIDFVTNRKGLIIGSALASNNPAVGGVSVQSAKLYVFTDMLDKFINHVSGSIPVTFNSQTVGPYTIQTLDLPSAELNLSAVSDGQFYLTVTGGTFPGSSGTQYKAWAIVTAQLSNTEQVEDEEGNQTTQTVQYGGDVLIAQNMDFSAGDTFSPIYFTKKKEVFDKTVWITAR